MKKARFAELVHEIVEDCTETLRVKGNDYARDDDALDNFKRIADITGVSIEKVWGVYANKHWDAINTYVRTGAVASEDISDRIMDAINYLFFLRAIIEQKANEPHVDGYAAWLASSNENYSSSTPITSPHFTSSSERTDHLEDEVHTALKQTQDPYKVHIYGVETILPAVGTGNCNCDTAGLTHNYQQCPEILDLVGDIRKQVNGG